MNKQVSNSTFLGNSQVYVYTCACICIFKLLHYNNCSSISLAILTPGTQLYAVLPSDVFSTLPLLYSFLDRLTRASFTLVYPRTSAFYSSPTLCSFRSKQTFLTDFHATFIYLFAARRSFFLLLYP